MKVKATEAVKYLEGISYFEDTKYSSEDANEVVRIADAIHATLLAELEALRWALKAEKTTIDNRIATLKDKLK